MESRRTTRSMTKASRARATPPHGGLPEEILLWEILVRLPPKSLLRCRAVCRAWRHATSTHVFLMAHHRRQPSLPIVYEYRNTGHLNILAFDHRAASARLKSVGRFEDIFRPNSSCDGLLIFSRRDNSGFFYSIFNPATRQQAPLRRLSRFTLLAMYAHRPSGEYRLLLYRTIADKTCCYGFALGSNQPPRLIEELEVAASASLHKPALVRDSLHWYPVHHQSYREEYQSASKVVIVFDTTAESFRQMRAPVVPAKSFIFEMDGTLGIYSCSDKNGTVDIWVLQNYENEVWAHKYNVKLLDEEIKGQSGWLNDIRVECVDGDILFLVSDCGRMFCVDIDGKLVEKFHCDGRRVRKCDLRLKQSLVPHTFFTTLEGYSVNA